MSAAHPAELHPLFAEAFNAGDAAALLRLYEPGATLVPEPGQRATGVEAIRAALGAFLALKGTMALTTRGVVPGEHLALLYGEWTLTGTAPDGSPLDMAGRSTEVARRQTDGTWRYVIDDPFSGA